MKPARASVGASGITVRHGQLIIHCDVGDLEEVLRAVTKCLQLGQATQDAELRRFPGEFLELFASEEDPPTSPGEALQAARPLLGTGLSNEVRGLIRARGAAVHEVPADKPARVLEAVRRAMAATPDPLQKLGPWAAGRRQAGSEEAKAPATRCEQASLRNPAQSRCAPTPSSEICPFI